MTELQLQLDCAQYLNLIILSANKIYFVELKVGNNKQSQEQKKFQDDVTRLGHKYYLVYAFGEFLEVIKGIGIKDYIKTICYRCFYPNPIGYAKRLTYFLNPSFSYLKELAKQKEISCKDLNMANSFN